jgi:hypothetical protein
MKILFKLTIAIAIAIFILGCNKNENSIDKTNENKTVAKDTTVKSDTISIIKNLTNKWNDCIVNKKYDALLNLYAKQINAYGKSKSNEQVVLDKKNFIQKYQDFSQTITGDINVIKITDNQYKAIFPKQTTFNGKVLNVEGHIIFEKTSDIWVIINESDDLTDGKISSNENSQLNKKLKNCADVVIEIVTTSPSFKKTTKGLNERVKKNGGKGYGVAIERSPLPDLDNAWDYSENFEISLHETYPDRIVTIRRYIFNPEKRELYLNDDVNNKLIKIEYDRNLLIQFDELCK